MSEAARRRWVLAGAILASLAVVGAARALDPDPRGYGTHESLGLPPCGMMLVAGIPCPSCGMTTAFAHASRLQFEESLQAHPCGLLMFVSVLVVVGVAMAGLVGPLSPERVESWVIRFPWWKAGIGFFTFLFLIWGYRIAMTLLLTA